MIERSAAAAWGGSAQGCLRGDCPRQLIRSFSSMAMEGHVIRHRRRCAILAVVLLAAVVVILGADGQVLQKQATTVGG